MLNSNKEHPEAVEQADPPPAGPSRHPRLPSMVFSARQTVSLRHRRFSLKMSREVPAESTCEPIHSDESLHFQVQMILLEGGSFLKRQLRECLLVIRHRPDFAGSGGGHPLL